MSIDAEDLQSLNIDELLDVYLANNQLSYLAGLVAITAIRRTFRSNPWKDKEVYGKYTVYSLDEQYNLLPKLVVEYVNDTSKKESFFIERV